jgi:hypothetical protein
MRAYPTTLRAEFALRAMTGEADTVLVLAGSMLYLDCGRPTCSAGRSPT